MIKYFNSFLTSATIYEEVNYPCKFNKLVW